MQDTSDHDVEIYCYDERAVWYEWVGALRNGDYKDEEHR